MNQDKWQELLIRVEKNFTVLGRGKESGQIEGELIEYIEWQMSDKQLRAEAHRKPKLINKKTIYSRRIGSTATEQNIYSADEEVFFTKFYERLDESDDWREVVLGDFA